MGELVAGVDEAGRGPWAGPVFAAAVILPPDCVEGLKASGLDDSKRMTPDRRAFLFDLICEQSTAYAIAMAPAAEIDRLNIHHATLNAMAQSVHWLNPKPERVLVDGKFVPTLEMPTEAIVGGDGMCPAISAASVLAKVARDRHMGVLDAAYPGYGWMRNKGYGTKEHRTALNSLGPTPEHRRSFRPIAAFYDV